MRQCYLLQPRLALSSVNVVVAVVVVHMCTILVCKCTFYLYSLRRGERVSEKSTLCTLVEMEIIMDDPLLIFYLFYLTDSTSN